MASGNKGQGNCAANEATRTSQKDSHFSLARRSDQPKNGRQQPVLFAVSIIVLRSRSACPFHPVISSIKRRSAVDVRFGSLADIATCARYVRFTPKAHITKRR